MNPKIKELALKANLEYNVFLPDAWSGENKDIERFAELIIKECLNELCNQMDVCGINLCNLPSWYRALEMTEHSFGIGRKL